MLSTCVLPLGTLEPWGRPLLAGKIGGLASCTKTKCLCSAEQCLSRTVGTKWGSGQQWLGYPLYEVASRLCESYTNNQKPLQQSLDLCALLYMWPMLLPPWCARGKGHDECITDVMSVCWHRACGEQGIVSRQQCHMCCWLCHSHELLWNGLQM